MDVGSVVVRSEVSVADEARPDAAVPSLIISEPKHKRLAFSLLDNDEIRCYEINLAAIPVVVKTPALFWNAYLVLLSRRFIPPRISDSDDHSNCCNYG